MIKNIFDSAYFSKTEQCYMSHPTMPIVIEGTEYLVYGGSCWTPKHTALDTYIGFDEGQSVIPYKDITKIPENIHYFIRDMQVPQSKESLDELLHAIAERLKQGKQVHLGCIGGHGRTGLVLVALVATYMNEVDPLKYVRSKYCSHAVETMEQEHWLERNYKVPLKLPKHQKKLGVKGKKVSDPTIIDCAPIPQHLRIL